MSRDSWGRELRFNVVDEAKEFLKSVPGDAIGTSDVKQSLSKLLDTTLEYTMGVQNETSTADDLSTQTQQSHFLLVRDSVEIVSTSFTTCAEMKHAATQIMRASALLWPAVIPLSSSSYGHHMNEMNHLQSFSVQFIGRLASLNEANNNDEHKGNAFFAQDTVVFISNSMDQDEKQTTPFLLSDSGGWVSIVSRQKLESLCYPLKPLNRAYGDTKSISRAMIASKIASICDIDSIEMRLFGTCHSRMVRALSNSHQQRFRIVFSQKLHDDDVLSDFSRETSHVLTKCSWFDVTLNLWSSSGCVTMQHRIHTNPSSGTNHRDIVVTSVLFECNHLTDFALRVHTLPKHFRLDNNMKTPTQIMSSNYSLLFLVLFELSMVHVLVIAFLVRKNKALLNVKALRNLMSIAIVLMANTAAPTISILLYDVLYDVPDILVYREVSDILVIVFRFYGLTEFSFLVLSLSLNVRSLKRSVGTLMKRYRCIVTLLFISILLLVILCAFFEKWDSVRLILAVSSALVAAVYSTLSTKTYLHLRRYDGGRGNDGGGECDGDGDGDHGDDSGMALLVKWCSFS